MLEKTRNPLPSYAAAILLPVIAIVLRVPLSPLLGNDVPFITFFPAVAVSALYGGIRVGLFTTLLSALIASYFLIPPIYAFIPTNIRDTVQIFMFLAIGSFISWICGERKKAVEGLQSKEHWFRALVEHSADSVAVIDKNNKILYVSPAVMTVEGYKPEELIGRNGIENTHPDDLILVEKIVSELLANPGKPIPVLWRRKHKNGQWIWLEGVAINLLDDPIVGGIVTNYRDVTERKKTEEAVNNVRAQLEAVFQSMQDGVVVTDMASEFLLVNETEARICGFASPEDMKKNLPYFASIFELTYPDGQSLPVEEWPLSKILKGKSIQDWELRGKRLDTGKEWFFSFSGEPVFDAGGKQILCVVITRDITERKRTERALRFSEERFAIAFNASPISSVIATLDEGRYIAANDTFLNLTGYKREEVIGHTSADLKIWSTPEAREEAIQLLKTQRRIRNRETTYRMKNGEERVFLTSIEIIELDGKPHLITASIDITERKRAEEALNVSEEHLRQSQKMEAVGKLAGGVAHDFNNLLTVIAGYSDLLLTTLNNDDPKKNYVVEIRRAGERASSLTNQLLAFSRKQMLEPKVLNLNNVVINTEKMLKRLIGEDINLTTILNPNISKVKVDPGQIEQVIINLAVNARDAMPQGGNLTIETSNIELHEDRWPYEFEYKPGNYITFTMTDTGCGMTPEIKSRIFEPFFTTKELGKGTGLGLSTVFGIIKQSGGNITVYSEVGVGTTFKLYFPAVEEVADSTSDKVSEVIKQGSETILLVEDEDAVRKIAKLALETWGYNVLEANGGQAAINIVEEYEGTIHLVISDVVMPGMSGRQLVEYLHSRYEHLKVLYISGYTDDAIVRHGIIEEENAFLQKPFTPPMLARKVREVLDSKN